MESTIPTCISLEYFLTLSNLTQVDTSFNTTVNTNSYSIYRMAQKVSHYQMIKKMY